MSWTGGSGSGNTRRLNTFLMSEDRWQRALKEHNTRVRSCKPAVDLKSPWGCSRPYVPLPPPDKHGQRPTSVSSARGTSTGRPTSAQSTGRRQQSTSRPTSAAAGGRPTSATSRASTSTSARGGGSGSARTGTGSTSGAQVISQMPLQQQRLCEDMTKLLSGLDKDASKAVLEHLFSAAEEGRLLRSYSGVYPGLLVSHSRNDNDDEDDKSFGEGEGEQQ